MRFTPNCIFRGRTDLSGTAVDEIFPSGTRGSFEHHRILRGNGYSDQCLSTKQYYVLVLSDFAPPAETWANNSANNQTIKK